MNSRHTDHVTDDLQRIKGIGDAIEKRLHEAGILTYAQLAALTPAEIAAIVKGLAGMSAEQIAKLDWPGRARELAAESVPVEIQDDVTDEGNPGNRQHDVSFTVRLLLNEDHSVRRTQIVDNRSKDDEDHWAGWDASRMEDFICQQADLQLPAAEPEPPVAAEAEAEEAIAAITEAVPAATPAAGPEPLTPTPSEPGSTLHLLELEVLPADGNDPHRVFRQGLPFSVRLSLDLAEAGLPNDEPLDYKATVYIKALGGGPRRAMGERHNTIIPNEHLTVFVPCRFLSEGSYHLVPEVTVSRRSPEPEIEVKLEGGILQIV